MTAQARPLRAVRPAAVWLAPPGALRVRPLPRESAASYLTRLAAAYHLGTAHLLDGLRITATGTPAAPPATELHLSCEAVRRLSGFTRIPPPHLNRALPRRPPPAAIGTAHTATARWQPLQHAIQPLPACTTCTIRRPPHHTAPAAWIHPAPDLPRAMICTRHQQASSDARHRTPLDVRALPELTHARLTARRPPTAASLSWATTIVTRWYDHRQHLHIRWQQRLHQLTAANPHLTHGPASPTLTCRNLITYPETLTLAAALDRLPPHPLTRTEQSALLHQLACRLRLPRLTARRPRPALATPDHPLNQPPCRTGLSAPEDQPAPVPTGAPTTLSKNCHATQLIAQHQTASSTHVPPAAHTTAPRTPPPEITTTAQYN